MEQHQMMVILI